MKKKNWLIGTIAAASVLVCGAVGIGAGAVNAAEGDKKASDAFIYEQLGRDDYTACEESGYTKTTWLGTSDKKHIAIISEDGTVTEIDNSTGKYGQIDFLSEEPYIKDVILSIDSEGKKTLLNYDGSYAYGVTEYYDRVEKLYPSVIDKNVYYFVSGKDVIVNNIEGETLVKITASGNVLHVKKVQDYYVVDSSSEEGYYVDIFDSEGNRRTDEIKQEGKTLSGAVEVGSFIQINLFDESASYTYVKYYDKNLKEADIAAEFGLGNADIRSLIYNDKYGYYVSYTKDGKYSKKYFDKELNDLESKVAQEGFEINSLYYESSRDCICVSYTKDGKSGYNKYFNKDFTPYSSSVPKTTVSITAEDIPDYSATSDTYYLFNQDVKNSESIKLADGYEAMAMGVLNGYKVYLGYKYDEQTGVNYAMFDENGEKLLSNIAGKRASIADKIVLSEKNDEGKSVYKIIKVSVAGETSDIKPNENGDMVTDVEVGELDKENIKDSEGNKVDFDKLDEDAQAIVNQKIDFSLKAGKDVLPADTKLSVSKVVSGKKYDAAKQVTQAVVNKMAVFNIDIFNKDNVKVQPNGMLEITADIPDGFNTAYVAVYRLSEDGKSYTKLKSKVVDDKIVFETDHFSTYMIVEEKESTGDSTKTGDMSNTFIYIVLMMAAGLTGVVAFRRKRA